MPIQAPQWTDYLNCPACCREFVPSRSPVSLGCGHTLCRLCLKNLHRKQCPFDQTVISVDLEELVVNTALLQLAGYTPPAQPYRPPCIKALCEQDKRSYDLVVKCLEHLAVYLKFCGNANNAMGSRLSRPMQRKLVTLLQCAMTDEEGRGKAARAARSLGDRTVTELIVQHQNPQQLSANLWAAVRSRGCQFLGPAMQEEVLKLVLLALEDGSALSRKVLVMFVVQRLEPHFPQASKTSIGHVVQLLYRASCFKVSKRVCDSSLMQLKEEFRTYESLRREHDAQIVQIATEAGLRIAPDQWSALLYGDTQHKSHMQSIIDKLQTPQSFAQSVQELFITLQRTGDPAQLIAMSIPLDRLANIDSSPDAESPTWQQLSAIMMSLKDVVSGLVHFMQYQTTGRDANHNAKERLPEPTGPQTIIQSIPGRYKVAMCRDAQTRTYCPRGNSCTYAHTEEELERYRRVNSTLNNGNFPYMMQPAIAVTRPTYQRFSVPPPPLPNMEHNFTMPPMQQQISPSSRRSMVGVDALGREQPYEHERDKTYEHQREPPYEHARDQPYGRAREQPYDITHEQSYDHARDHARGHHREQTYDHPPPNVSADNFVASYATALRHGSDNMGRSVGPSQSAQHQHQNGNVNTMMPPPGRYYPRYVERSAYPYMPHIDNGRISNEELSQYPGMSGSIGPVEPPHDYPGLEYPQQPYIDENGPELHFETLSFGMSVARPIPITQPQEPAWPTNNSAKCQQMFKFDEMAKNLPIGIEIGKSMPIGLDLGKNVPIGRDMATNMPIGMDMATNLPIGREMGNNMPICIEMGNNMPIGIEMGTNMPIGLEMGTNMPIGMEMGKNIACGREMGNNIPIGREMVTNMPIGREMGNNMPIGREIGTNMTIGREMGKNVAIGMEMTNNLPIGMPQTNGEMIHHGLETVRMKPKVRTANEKRDDQELEKELKALEKRISTEFSKASDQLDTDVDE